MSPGWEKWKEKQQVVCYILVSWGRVLCQRLNPSHSTNTQANLSHTHHVITPNKQASIQITLLDSTHKHYNSPLANTNLRSHSRCIHTNTQRSTLTTLASAMCRGYGEWQHTDDGCPDGARCVWVEDVCLHVYVVVKQVNMDRLCVWLRVGLRLRSDCRQTGAWSDFLADMWLYPICYRQFERH